MITSETIRRTLAITGVGALAITMASCGDGDAGDVVDDATAEVSEVAEDVSEDVDDIDVDVDVDDDDDGDA